MPHPHTTPRFSHRQRHLLFHSSFAPIATSLNPHRLGVRCCAPTPPPPEQTNPSFDAPHLTRRATVRLLCAAALAASVTPPSFISSATHAVGDGGASSAETKTPEAGETAEPTSDIDPATDEPRITAKVYVDFGSGSASASNGEGTLSSSLGLGRVVIGVYGELLPVVADNFLALARAHRYDNTPVYRIVPGLTVQLGDVLRNGGKSGVSGIADDGAPFTPDNFRVSHTIPGIVSMVRTPDGRVDSRFFIATRPGDSKYLDGKFAAFGRIVDGMEVLQRIEREASSQFVKKPVRVVSCGILE